MYELCYKNGLLYTSVVLYSAEKSVSIDDVIVDTGAFHTIILTDYLENLDFPLEDADELVKTSGYGGVQYSSVRKTISKLAIGDICLENMKIDFGNIDPFERVNGLIGLDFLMGAGLIIDLVELKLYKKYS